MMNKLDETPFHDSEDCPYVGLYVPGNKPGMIENATAFSISNLILCLEDGTPSEKKIEGRFLLRRSLPELRLVGKHITIRINSVDSEWFMDDIKMLIPALPNRLRVPKIKSVDEVERLERLIDSIASESNVRLEVMVETLEGLNNLDEIIKVSKRIIAVTVGGADLRESIISQQGFCDDKELWEAKAELVRIAKLNGLKAYDTTYMQLHDEQGFLEDSKQSCSLGFSGRSIIHPAQYLPAVSAYSRKGGSCV